MTSLACAEEAGYQPEGPRRWWLVLLIAAVWTVYLGYVHLCPRAAWIDRCRPSLLITESTYATTIRDSKRCRERDFLKKVHETVERGGKVGGHLGAPGRLWAMCPRSHRGGPMAAPGPQAAGGTLCLLSVEGRFGKKTLLGVAHSPLCLIPVKGTGCPSRSENTPQSLPDRLCLGAGLQGRMLVQPVVCTGPRLSPGRDFCMHAASGHQSCWQGWSSQHCLRRRPQGAGT